MKNYTITVNGNVYDVVVEEGASIYRFFLLGLGRRFLGKFCLDCGYKSKAADNKAD